MTDTTPEPAQPVYADPEQIPVHLAINRVMRDVEAVDKNGNNAHHKYRFRSVDDVITAMSAPMATHGVFIVPKVLARETEPMGASNLRTLLTIEYTIYGPKGDSIVTEIIGEAGDTADKGVSKAMSAAFKYLLFEVFAIPVGDDPDAHSPQQDNRFAAAVNTGIRKVAAPDAQTLAQSLAEAAEAATDFEEVKKGWAKGVKLAKGLKVEIGGEQVVFADYMKQRANDLKPSA